MTSLTYIFSEQSFRDNMPIICAVGLFCCDEFEETPNKKVVNMSKLTKPQVVGIYLNMVCIASNFNSGILKVHDTLTLIK